MRLRRVPPLLRHYPHPELPGGGLHVRLEIFGQ